MAEIIFTKEKGVTTITLIKAENYNSVNAALACINFLDTYTWQKVC